MRSDGVAEAMERNKLQGTPQDQVQEQPRDDPNRGWDWSHSVASPPRTDSHHHAHCDCQKPAGSRDDRAMALVVLDHGYVAKCECAVERLE